MNIQSAIELLMSHLPSTSGVWKLLAKRDEKKRKHLVTEKRKTRRHEKEVTFQYTLLPDRASILHYSVTRNVSARGICFLSGHPFSPNQRVTLGGITKKIVHGTVKWQKELHGAVYKVGIELNRDLR